jgi:hypothetical protein
MIPFGLIDIRPHVLPATNVVFSIPMPSVAMHLGPIAMFPRNEKVTIHAQIIPYHAL